MEDDRELLWALCSALTAGWSRETSSDPSRWSAENAAWGQCAVTALVVQDYLGGSMLRGEVGSASHYWNVLPSGDTVDLTRSQFGRRPVIENIESRTRDYVLSYPETEQRYRQLFGKVNDYLRREGGAE
jgi:hypothetical protein